MTTVRILDHMSNNIARVSILWDGYHVVITKGSECFAVPSREVALYCFKILATYAPDYLREVVEGKRPTPPVSFLKERFPFDQVPRNVTPKSPRRATSGLDIRHSETNSVTGSLESFGK
jgi:hypothetical protein